jgi:hypothetical protein
MAAAASPKPKAGKPVTTRHLAAALSEQHQVTKEQGLQMLEVLIGMITKHLKKGERVKISGLGILVVQSAPPAWAVTDDWRGDQDRPEEKRLPAPPGMKMAI